MSSRESFGKRRLNSQHKNEIKTQEHLIDEPQPYEIDVNEGREEEDEGLAEKLAELRIEVQKRDIQRKFEAIQN